MSEKRTITSITVQNKRKDRYSIFLDHEYAFGLDRDVLLKSGIARGDELTAEQINEILELEQAQRAKDKALRLLAVRARSKQEIIDRLRMSKYSTQSIQWVVAELERLQFLNDEEFAAMYVRSRMATRPVGAMVLRQELKQKGVSEAFMESSIQQVFQENSESEVALILARKKKKQVQELEEAQAKKRVADFLMRRGFQWDIVGDIIARWSEI